MNITAEERQLLAVELPKLPRKVRAIIDKLVRIYDKHQCLAELAVTDLPGEEWRDVTGYEGFYQISNKGRVKSFYNSRVRILRPCISKAGYPTVILHKDGTPKTYLVHRLVAQAFIPNPENKPEVDHGDNNRSNASVENLQWATSKENSEASVKRGTHQAGSKSVCARFTADEVRYIRRIYKPYDKNYGASALARKFNVTGDTIKRIIRRQTYKDVD